MVLQGRGGMGCPSRTGANGAVEYHTASDAQVRTRPTRTREEDVARVVAAARDWGRPRHDVKLLD